MAFHLEGSRTRGTGAAGLASLEEEVEDEGAVAAAGDDFGEGVAGAGEGAAAAPEAAISSPAAGDGALASAAAAPAFATSMLNSASRVVGEVASGDAATASEAEKSSKAATTTRAIDFADDDDEKQSEITLLLDVVLRASAPCLRAVCFAMGARDAMEAITKVRDRTEAARVLARGGTSDGDEGNKCWV